MVDRSAGPREHRRVGSRARVAAVFLFAVGCAQAILPPGSQQETLGNATTGVASSTATESGEVESSGESGEGSCVDR